MNHSFETWVEAHKDISFRYWVHKKLFTPYEEEQKFEDQCLCESDECSYEYIVDYAILPDNDILLGLSEDKEAGYISYYKLSAIDLALSKKDNEEE